MEEDLVVDQLDPAAGTPAGDKTFSQADLDKIITKRLAKEQSKWKSELDEVQRLANLSDVEKLKAEKDEAITKAEARMKSANEKLFKADFKSLANTLGIVDTDVALMLIDKTDLQNEEGEVDMAALKTSLETLITNKPYLKGVAQQNPIPFLPGSPAFKNSGTLTKDQLKKMTAEQISKLDFALVTAALKQ